MSCFRARDQTWVERRSVFLWLCISLSVPFFGAAFEENQKDTKGKRPFLGVTPYFGALFLPLLSAFLPRIFGETLCCFHEGPLQAKHFWRAASWRSLAASMAGKTSNPTPLSRFLAVFSPAASEVAGEKEAILRGMRSLGGEPSCQIWAKYFRKAVSNSSHKGP